MREPFQSDAVLVLEQDELAVRRHARRAPRVLKQHESEQSEHLRLVRHEDGEQLREPDRLVAQVVADVVGARAWPRSPR